MLPPVGFVFPQIRSSNVVFPAPLGPITTRSSSCSTEKSRLSTALKPSKETVRFLISSSELMSFGLNCCVGFEGKRDRRRQAGPCSADHRRELAPDHWAKVIDSSGKSLGEEPCHQDEHAPHEEVPEVGKHF